MAAAKTHIFYIKGMNNLTKHKVEETLVGVKGVVSFLIDVHTHKAVVRTLTNPGIHLQNIYTYSASFPPLFFFPLFFFFSIERVNLLHADITIIYVM